MERPKFRLNVLIDNSVSQTENHAQKFVREQTAREFRHLDSVMPRGIAVHTAVYPEICEECGETYWAHDPYTSHIGCKKKKSPGLGFS